MSGASSSYAGRSSSAPALDELGGGLLAAERVDRDVPRDREHPRAQVLAVLEAAVRLEGAQEGLLERVLGSLAAEPPAEQPEHLDSVLLVEALERGYRHGAPSSP